MEIKKEEEETHTHPPHTPLTHTFQDKVTTNMSSRTVTTNMSSRTILLSAFGIRERRFFSKSQLPLV